MASVAVPEMAKMFAFQYDQQMIPYVAAVITV
jgi:hypothetical protein